MLQIVFSTFPAVGQAPLNAFLSLEVEAGECP